LVSCTFRRYRLLLIVLLLFFVHASAAVVYPQNESIAVPADNLVLLQPEAKLLVPLGTYITIAPVGTRYVGEKITITATTDLPVGSDVLVEVMQAAFSPTSKTQSGEFSGATGTVTVSAGENKTASRIRFDVDLSTFRPGDYHILATSVADSAVSGTGEFTVAAAGMTREPVPVFIYSPHPAVSGEQVTFDGTGSSDPDGKIVTYQWDFGDGTPLTIPAGSADGARVSHTYRTEGMYRAGLRVMDDSQQYTWAYNDVTVILPVPPVADFSLYPAEGYASENHPLAVTITDRSTGSPQTWVWFVNDRLVSRQRTYSPGIFTEPGNYTIRLVVTNNFGRSAKEKQVMVLPIETATTVVTRQPTSLVTTVVPTRVTTIPTVPPCGTGGCPCEWFTIPCIWIDVIIAGIVVVVATMLVLKYLPRPPGVSIETRSGISSRGIDTDNFEVCMDTESGIRYSEREEDDEGGGR
jgi:PKD repeat protein